MQNPNLASIFSKVNGYHMPHFDVENRLREYLIASWTSYPKPIKGALTIILKSPLKLLITSSYNGKQLVFLENQIIF